MASGMTPPKPAAPGVPSTFSPGSLPCRPPPESPAPTSPEPLLPFPGPLPASLRPQSPQPLTSSTRTPDGGGRPRVTRRTSPFRNVCFREPQALSPWSGTSKWANPSPPPPTTTAFRGPAKAARTPVEARVRDPHAGPRRGQQARCSVADRSGHLGSFHSGQPGRLCRLHPWGQE